MFERFIAYIVEKKLFSRNDKILLGFSGGADSVALAYLLYKTGYKLALAHVNFHLRGEEADRDQFFSKKFAEKLGLEFFTVDFDTITYARKHKLSVEEAARVLRYQWFEQIRSEHGFDYVATAHNADDNVETILHNLARGTGLRGLLGIPVKRDNIVRPLLFAFKDEIVAFCRQNNLDYRIDSTNQQTQFTRNKIRHLIIPKFQQVNPNFKNNVLRTVNILHQINDLTQSYIKKCRSEVVSEVNGEIWIDKGKLMECEYAELFLFELLADYDFSPGQIDQVRKMMNSQAGTVVSSKFYQVVNDRKYLILSRICVKDATEYLLEKDAEVLLLNGWRIRTEILDRKDISSLKQPENIALLDYEKLHFPLKIRHWEEGDFFYPLGLHGKKKLSDFFTDKKVPLHKKSSIWILESNGQIVWVMGYRIDERFKVTDLTKNVFKIIMEKNED